MRSKKILRFSIYLAISAVMLAQTCFAYIDPATTSYIITIISAVVIACGTAIGIVANKLKRRLKGKKKEEEELPQNVLSANTEGEDVVITADDLLSGEEDSGSTK